MTHHFPVQLQYEHQISELEQQLAQKPQWEAVCEAPPEGQVQTVELQQELERVKQAHHSTEHALRQQLQSLQQQLSQKVCVPSIRPGVDRTSISV